MAIIVTEGPYIHHYSPYIGDTFSRSMEILEGDPAALVDLSDDTFRIIIERLDTQAVLHTLTLGDGIEITGTGEITWTLTSAQTATWPVNARLRYEIKRTTAGGSVKTLQAGFMDTKKLISN